MLLITIFNINISLINGDKLQDPDLPDAENLAKSCFYFCLCVAECTDQAQMQVYMLCKCVSVKLI